MKLLISLLYKFHLIFVQIMAIIHFLNVLEGDCNIIQHDSGRLTVIDVSNAFNNIDTEEEKKVKTSQEREDKRL